MAVKRVTKYYKYIYEPFIQPVLTEDGILGGDTFAVYATSSYNSSYYPWKAFDGNNNTHWASKGFKTGIEYVIYNPTPLNLTSITVRNKEDDEYYIQSGQILGSNDNQQWTIIKEEFTNDIKTVNAEWTINFDNLNAYKYYKILILTGTGNLGFTNLTLHAQQRTYKESTPDDYDFTMDVPAPLYLLKNTMSRIIDLYYKYQESDFVQPVLAANGTLGGSNFAVYASSEYSSSYAAWKAFDGNYNTSYAASGHPTGLEYIIYNPKPLKLTSIVVNNRYGSTDNILTYQIQGSNDNLTWSNLTQEITNEITTANSVWPMDLEKQNFYKYYKILILTGAGNTGFTSLTLQGKVRNIITGDKNDFDFIEQKIIKNTGLSAVARENKYYKYEYLDWEQPILSENGTIGGNKYACTSDANDGNEPWRVFDGNNDTYYGNSNNIPCFFTFYSPYPLLLKRADFKSYSSWYTYNITLQGSNDNLTWNNLGTHEAKTADEEYTMDINTDNAYQYFRIYCTYASGSDIGIRTINFTAQQVGVKEVSQEDNYDFVINKPVSNLFDLSEE